MKIEKFEKLVGDDYNVVIRCGKCRATGYFCDLRRSETCERNLDPKDVDSHCNECRMLQKCDRCGGRGEYYKYVESTPEGLM
jgi:hypothetical protein